MMFTIKKVEVVLWVGSGILLTLWISCPVWPHWEPLLGIINLIAIVVIRWLNKRLEKAEYSPALALALGYVNNYLEPLITGILRKNKEFQVIIYIPKKLSELSNSNIERVKHKMEAMNLSLSKVNVELEKKGRIRSCLEVKSLQNHVSIKYFDFPETLKSLDEYVNYKIASKKNELNRMEKDKMIENLIHQFYSTLNELIFEKSLNGYIQFVNEGLKFESEA